MELRLAASDDLSKVQDMYRNIIRNMNKNNISIWDEVYPCEFFENDIKQNRLYVLEEHDEILSAFALCDSNPGAGDVMWKNNDSKALYMERLGVHVDYLGKGIGSIMLHKAIELATQKGIDYVRLFVADINEPAIHLYIKNKFEKADGIYEERIYENFILHELGFEIKISRE
jgi:diamine N-acetyltransferase